MVGMTCQIGRLKPEADLRISPEGSGAAAGNVGKDDVEVCER